MIKENSKNKFLGGKLTILQQREGFRAGHDSVLLASSIPAKKGDKCLELGIGTGVVSLCLMKRVPGLSLIGIDNDRDSIKLLKENISLNGFDRLRLVRFVLLIHMNQIYKMESLEKLL